MNKAINEGRTYQITPCFPAAESPLNPTPDALKKRMYRAVQYQHIIIDRHAFVCYSALVSHTAHTSTLIEEMWIFNTCTVTLYAYTCVV